MKIEPANIQARVMHSSVVEALGVSLRVSLSSCICNWPRLCFHLT